MAEHAGTLPPLVTILGPSGSALGYAIRDFLYRSDVPFEWVQLASDAQARIRRFAIEERLEHGLAPVELLELYRGFDISGDRRAQQYLDRVYVDRSPPADWLDLQMEAGRLIDMAEARGRDAGRLFADLLRASPGLEPVTAMRVLQERLFLQKN